MGSGDCVEALALDQRQKFQGCAGGLFFAAFPFADQAGRYVQVVREHGLADVFPFADLFDFVGRQVLDWREACLIEATHGPLIDGTDFMQRFHGFVDGRERFTAILLAHFLLPR